MTQGCVLLSAFLMSIPTSFSIVEEWNYSIWKKYPISGQLMIRYLYLTAYLVLQDMFTLVDKIGSLKLCAGNKS